MKKRWLLLGMLVLLGGCTQEENIKPNLQEEEIADSITEVEGTQAFARTGADIEAPAGAENARYYIISEEIAEIRFIRNDTQYNYRASQFDENPAGIQPETQAVEEVQAVVGDYRIPIQEAKGNYLATWKWGGISYSLTAEATSDQWMMKSLVEELARETMPAQV